MASGRAARGPNSTWLSQRMAPAAEGSYTPEMMPTLPTVTNSLAMPVTLSRWTSMARVE